MKKKTEESKYVTREELDGIKKDLAQKDYGITLGKLTCDIAFLQSSNGILGFNTDNLARVYKFHSYKLQQIEKRLSALEESKKVEDKPKIKYCKDCYYCRPEAKVIETGFVFKKKITTYGYDFAKCGHGTVIAPCGGKPFCSTMREPYPGFCGPEGIHWTPKDV